MISISQIETVAEAVHKLTSRVKYSDIHVDRHKYCIRQARTIHRSWLCGMNEVGATAALARWWSVDNKGERIHDWVVTEMAKQAIAGYKVLNGE